MLKISNFKKRKRPDKHTIEARVSVYGKRISISAKTEEELNERIRKYCCKYNMQHSKVHTPFDSRTAIPALTPKPPRGPLFKDYSLKYVESAKKGQVSKRWYEHQKRNIEMYLNPILGEKFFDEITIFDCQEILSKVRDMGFNRTTEDLHNLLNQIFEYAEYDGYITKNPMKRVKFRKHERKKGRALTYEEEVNLLSFAKGTRYERNVLLLLYSGLRACECATARISDDGKFIEASNSKQKTKKKETKYIPITPMMRKHLDVVAVEPTENITVSAMTSWFKEKTDEGMTTRACRHTFNTRLTSFKINPEFRELAMGHKSSTVNIDTYTHYEDVRDVYYEEFQRVDYSRRLDNISPTLSPKTPRRDHHKTI